MSESVLYLERRAEAQPLSHHIEVIFYLDGYDPEHQVERLVPDGRVSLVVELDGRPRYIYENDSLKVRQECVTAWLSGVHTHYLSISALRGTELFAVRIPPGRGYPLIQQPLYRLNDRVVLAADVFGESIHALRDRVIATPDPDVKLQCVEDWLWSIFDPRQLPPPEVEEAVARIVEQPTVATLEGLLSELRFSRKHLIHLFKKYVGPTPKTLQRVLRFWEAIVRIQQRGEVDWAELSADCGYFDQAHFIKDFQRFSGFRPGEFHDAGHDRLNFFPADP
jgi:AraC-like DNA-binding protein